MSDIVSLSLSTETGMTSHLCNFLHMDATAEDVQTRSGTEFTFASAAHKAVIGHPKFKAWERRVAQTVHFRKIFHEATQRGNGTGFDMTAVATELGVQTMLEMFTHTDAPACNKPLVQWIDAVAFSYRVHTRLTADRLGETIHSKMTSLDDRIHIRSITGPIHSMFIVHCEIASVWELPLHVLALSNVGDETIAIIPFPDGRPSPCVDRIELTVLAATSAIELIRNCNFHGVATRKWRNEPHTRRDKSAARALVRFSTQSHRDGVALI